MRKKNYLLLISKLPKMDNLNMLSRGLAVFLADKFFEISR